MIANLLILLLATFTVLYAGLCVYAYVISDSMIFPAPMATYEGDETILKLNSSDGETLSAYYLPADQSSKVLLYSHGNGEDLGDIRPLLNEFHKRGVSVFAYDYPGYGTSTGKPSEPGVYAAAEAAYSYLTDQLNYSPADIVLYGRSLGSGPSCWLAEHFPVGGLILDGAFSSTFRVLTRVKLLPFDKFDNLARLRDMELRTLLIHGKRDFVVPFAHAIKNQKALKGNATSLWVESAGHNGLIEIVGERYWEVVLDFIQD